MIGQMARRYGIVTSALITAVLAVSMITMPSAAAITTLFTDPQDDCLNSSGPECDPNLDIKEVGTLDTKIPYMKVYGKAGGTVSEVAGEVVYYALNTDVGTYFITSHFGVEDSTEVKNDQQFHAHKLVEIIFSSTDCPNGYGHELVLNDEGRAIVTPKQILLIGTSATTVESAGSGILVLELHGSHVCYVSDVDFGDLVPNT